MTTFDYIYVNDKEYISREFEYTDRFGEKHCFVVADESILEVLDENLIGDPVDVGIYGYMPVSFFIETINLNDQQFAEKLNEHIDMDL